MCHRQEWRCSDGLPQVAAPAPRTVLIQIRVRTATTLWGGKLWNREMLGRLLARKRSLTPQSISAASHAAWHQMPNTSQRSSTATATAATGGAGPAQQCPGLPAARTCSAEAGCMATRASAAHLAAALRVLQGGGGRPWWAPEILVGPSQN